MTSILTIKKQYYKQLDNLDLEIILSYVLQKRREFILSHPEFQLTEKQLFATQKLIKRRINHEPIAYLINQKEFYNLNFFVNESVLIPRPETELIIDEILKESEKSKTEKLFIDIGTGSGCIIITLSKLLKESSNEFIGIDVSKEALIVAKKNSKTHKVNHKIKFIQSNLLNKIFDQLSNNQKEIYLIANLPYLSDKIYSSTPADVKKFEPRKALLSPAQGFHHYKLLIQQIKKLQEINPDLKINLYIEFSPEQLKFLQMLIKNNLKSKLITIKKDLAKKDRLLIAKTY